MWSGIVNSPSKSLFVVVLGFLLGIFVGAVIGVPLSSLWLVAGMLGALVGVVLSVPHAACRLPFLILFFFLFGLWRFDQVFYPVDANLVSETLNREIRIEGVVSDEVVEKAQSQQVVIDQVRIADEHALGKVMVWMPKYPTISFGDEVAFRCQLEVPEPFDGFAYDKYLRVRGVLAVCWYPESVDVRSVGSDARKGVTSISNILTDVTPFRGLLFDFKHAIYDKTEQIFAEPHSTFLSGLLFGGKGSLASDLRQDFVDTGTSHILAASGYNVGIFSRFLFLGLVAWFFRRRTALAIVAAAIALYVVIAGFDPAVTRAGIMGLIIVFGRSLGRARNDSALRNILALTAAAMLFVNPRLLLDDVGFQLSFLATIGLVMIVPRIEHKFKFIPTTGGFREAIVSTVAATIMSLPILILQFGQLSIVSPLVNFLVLPLVPYAMGFGAITILVGAVSVKLAAIVSAAAWTCLSVMLYIIRAFGSLSIASVSVPGHEIVASVIALLLIGWLVWLYRKVRLRRQHFHGSRRWGLAMTALILLFLSSLVLQFVNSVGTSGMTGFSLLNNTLKGVTPPMHVWFFDVGQGDAIFIQTPDNKQILVDGGPGEAVLSKLGSVMPFWDRSLDMVVLTHPHSDHISGLIEVLDRYQVDQIVMTGVNYQSIYLEAFEERVVQEGAQITIVDEPMMIDVPHAARRTPFSLEVLYPLEAYYNQHVDELNETSIVLELTYGKTSVLLTGDIYVEQEAEVIHSLDHPVDILKVAHQGSKSSTSVEFLEAIDPETAIITVGENSYGHPHAIVLRRLQDRDIEVYRTDLDGDVLLVSDGEDPEVMSRWLMF